MCSLCLQLTSPGTYDMMPVVLVVKTIGGCDVDARHTAAMGHHQCFLRGPTLVLWTTANSRTVGRVAPKTCIRGGGSYIGHGSNQTRITETLQEANECVIFGFYNGCIKGKTRAGTMSSL